jgi:hypothetical protein
MAALSGVAESSAAELEPTMSKTVPRAPMSVYNTSAGLPPSRRQHTAHLSTPWVQELCASTAHTRALPLAPSVPKRGSFDSARSSFDSADERSERAALVLQQQQHTFLAAAPNPAVPPPIHGFRPYTQQPSPPTSATTSATTSTSSQPAVAAAATTITSNAAPPMTTHCFPQSMYVAGGELVAPPWFPLQQRSGLPNVETATSNSPPSHGMEAMEAAETQAKWAMLGRRWYAQMQYQYQQAYPAHVASSIVDQVVPHSSDCNAPPESRCGVLMAQ